MSKMRNLIAGLLCLLGIGLFLINPIRNHSISKTSAKYTVNKIDKKVLKENEKVDASFDFEAVETLDPVSVLVDEDNGLPVIGGIAIPELGMNLPIFKGLDNTALAYGAGTTSETQKMGQGNYGLASHHVFAVPGAEQVLFSPLENAQAGMLIYITDKETIYQYRATSVERVTPDRVDVLDEVPDKKLITLVTCTDFNATGRIIVQGELIAEEEYTGQGTSKVFSGNFSQMDWGS